MTRIGRLSLLAIASLGSVLLPGCAEGGGGSSGANGDANVDPLEEVVRLEGAGIAVEVDGRTALRVYLQDANGDWQALSAPFGEVDPSARLVVADEWVDDFVRTDSRIESAAGALGPGQRLTVEGRSRSRSIERTAVLEAPDDYPGVVLVRTRYTSQDRDLAVDAIIEHDFELQAVDPPSDGPRFWSFQGGAEVWGQDYVMPLVNGQDRRNEQPLNGGVPYCDVWSRGGGLGVGSASTGPRRLAIPVRAAEGNAWLSFEWPGRTLPQGQEVEVGATLLVAHAGDVFVGARSYARAMAALGVAPPESPPATAYLQHWETYGYEEAWTLDDITWRLEELVELGIGVVTIDSGWYVDFSTGDYVPDPAVVCQGPEPSCDGDEGFRALTDAIHEAGLLAKLWWQPGNVERDSDLAAEHLDWMVLDEEGGEPPFAPDPAGNPNDYGDEGGEELTDYMLCPAVDEVVEYHREFVTRAIEVWGFDGFKMDYIYGVPRCYAEAHEHDSPDDSIEAYPTVYRTIAETARQLRPDAILNVCNCGVPQSFYLYPHQNQLITSDPVGSRQMRIRTKVQKAFFGPAAPVLCDHVELSLLINRQEDERDGPVDFASCLGVGAVLQTKYTELESDGQWDRYWTWLNLGRELELASGEYLGGLYTYGFDRPEAHVVRKDDVVYYGFFVEPWGATFAGQVELRGLGSGKYRIEDYVVGEPLGSVEGPAATLEVEFENSLLVRAVLVDWRAETKRRAVGVEGEKHSGRPISTPSLPATLSVNIGRTRYENGNTQETGTVYSHRLRRPADSLLRRV
ncbi:MAG: alpha-galactosidase [Phycisphaerae bacterium]